MSDTFKKHWQGPESGIKRRLEWPLSIRQDFDKILPQNRLFCQVTEGDFKRLQHATNKGVTMTKKKVTDKIQNAIL